MDWREKHKRVEAAARSILNARPEDAEPLSTAELAHWIAPGSGMTDAQVASVLTKITGRFSGDGTATHDGPFFMAYGRRYRRWVWHGQKRRSATTTETEKANGTD